jgi:hypothetical protein
MAWTVSQANTPGVEPPHNPWVQSIHTSASKVKTSTPLVHNMAVHHRQPAPLWPSSPAQPAHHPPRQAAYRAPPAKLSVTTHHTDNTPQYTP